MPRSALAISLAAAFAAAFSPIGAMAVGTTNWDANAGLAPLAGQSIKLSYRTEQRFDRQKPHGGLGRLDMSGTRFLRPVFDRGSEPYVFRR